MNPHLYVLIVGLLYLRTYNCQLCPANVTIETNIVSSGTIVAQDLISSNCNSSVCDLLEILSEINAVVHSCDLVACSNLDPCAITECEEGVCIVTGYLPFCCSIDNQCFDGNPCTSDSCISNQCVNAPVGCSRDSDCPSNSICLNCSCSVIIPNSIQCINDFQCDDNIICTLDFCGLNNKCRNIAIPNCCKMDSNCISSTVPCSLSNVCNNETGMCIHIPTDDDGDGIECFLDCNDTNPLVGGPQEYCRDQDADGYGTPTSVLPSCSVPQGYSPVCTDCDDVDFCVHPGQPDFCDGFDGNCNGIINNINDSVDCTNLFNIVEQNIYARFVPFFSNISASVGLSFSDALIGGKPSMAFIAANYSSGPCSIHYVRILDYSIPGSSLISIVNISTLCNVFGSIPLPWDIQLEGAAIPQSISLVDMGGVPAIAYTYTHNFDFRYAYNTDPNGANPWVSSQITSEKKVLAVSMVNLSGANRPGIFYVQLNVSTDLASLYFASNTNSDGSGTWAISVVSSSSLSNYTDVYACIVSGLPAVSAKQEGLAVFAVYFFINSNPFGSGVWNSTSIGGLFFPAKTNKISMTVTPNGFPIVAYSDSGLGNILVAISSSLYGLPGTWTNQIVDSTFSYRSHTRISTLNNFVFISYMQQPQKRQRGILKLAHNCYSEPRSGFWDTRTISVPGLSIFPDSQSRPGLLPIDNIITIPYSQLANFTTYIIFQ